MPDTKIKSYPRYQFTRKLLIYKNLLSIDSSLLPIPTVPLEGAHAEIHRSAAFWIDKESQNEKSRKIHSFCGIDRPVWGQRRHTTVDTRAKRIATC
jgi:hypothetical protein